MSSCADRRKGCISPSSHAPTILSFPGHCREIVDEDRYVLPQALQLSVRHRHVRQLEEESVHAVLGELLLRFAERGFVGLEVRRGGHLGVDVTKRLAVV